MEVINNCFENLNQEVRFIKPLRKVEKYTGIEPGSTIIICASIIFCMVLFGNFPRFICEVQGLLYPAYVTIYRPINYWYTYWIIYSLITLFFTILPSWSIIFSIRFLAVSYFLVPEVTDSLRIHEKLSEKLYLQLKTSE